MRWISIVLLLAGCCLAQDPKVGARVHELSRGFLRDSAEERERAAQEIKALGPSALPALQELLKEKLDPEAASRIRQVIKELWIVKAEALFKEGLLAESLKALATAESPADPEGFLKVRVEAARKDLLAALDDSGAAVVRRVSETGSRLKEKHGRWMLPVVFELLSPTGLDRPEYIQNLLLCWSADIPPILITCLKDKDDRLVSRVCDLLLFFGRGNKNVLKALEVIMNDPARNESLKALVRGTYIELGGHVERR